MYFILPKYCDLFSNIGNISLNLYLIPETAEKAVSKRASVVLEILIFSNNRNEHQLLKINLS